MTHHVYPRLRFHAARLQIAEIASAYQGGGLPALAGLVSYSHPKAEPVATGGQVADDSRIAQVRKAAAESVAEWMERGEVGRTDAGAFDRAIGRALHDTLDIVPGDAAHEETWNFLSLCVMPDLVVLRFPEMHEDRMFGTPRNPLRSAWLRRDTLGDLTERYERPLGVDEMVGLFERSDMARNRPLIRALARAVMEYKGPGSRMDWAREVYKEVRYSTGPQALDGWSEEELFDLVRSRAGRHVSRVTPDLSWADVAFQPQQATVRQQP